MAECHTEERIVGNRSALRCIVLLTGTRLSTVGGSDFFVGICLCSHVLVEKGFVGVVMDDKSTRSANAREVAARTTQQLKPHLLIVDDDLELCEILKRYLE